MSLLFAETAFLLNILKYMKKHGTDEGYDGLFMQFADYLKFIGADEYKVFGDKYLRD